MLSVKQYEHKGGGPWLNFLQAERSRYPSDQMVYMIQDGFSAHWTDEIQEWAKRSKVALIAESR